MEAFDVLKADIYHRLLYSDMTKIRKKLMLPKRQLKRQLFAVLWSSPTAKTLLYKRYKALGGQGMFFIQCFFSNNM
jgi:hypothetical protein